MFEIGERVMFETTKYKDFYGHMCYQRQYIKEPGIILAKKLVVAQTKTFNGKRRELIPAHYSYTVELEDGTITQGWTWRLNKINP